MSKTVTKYVIGTKDKKLFRDDWGDMVDDIDFCVLSDSPTNLEMLLQDLNDDNLMIIPVQVSYSY